MARIKKYNFEEDTEIQELSSICGQLEEWWNEHYPIYQEHLKKERIKRNKGWRNKEDAS